MIDPRSPAEGVEPDSAHETSQSIAAWQLATFGEATPRVTVLRAMDEMIELLELVFAPQKESGSAHYINQIKMCVRRLARVYGTEPAFDAAKASEEVADIGIVLSPLHVLAGTDAPIAIDRKMVKNRARQWHTNGDGTGQHVKDGDE